MKKLENFLGLTVSVLTLILILGGSHLSISAQQPKINIIDVVSTPSIAIESIRAIYVSNTKMITIGTNKGSLLNAGFFDDPVVKKLSFTSSKDKKSLIREIYSDSGKVYVLTIDALYSLDNSGKLKSILSLKDNKLPGIISGPNPEFWGISVNNSRGCLVGVYIKDGSQERAIDRELLICSSNIDDKDSWRTATTPNSAEKHIQLTSVSFSEINPSYGWTVGTEGTIWYTTDGGNTWEEQSTETTGFEDPLLSVIATGNTKAWAVGYNNAVYSYNNPNPERPKTVPTPQPIQNTIKKVKNRIVILKKRILQTIFEKEVSFMKEIYPLSEMNNLPDSFKMQSINSAHKIKAAVESDKIDDNNKVKLKNIQIEPDDLPLIKNIVAEYLKNREVDITDLDTVDGQPLGSTQISDFTPTNPPSASNSNWIKSSIPLPNKVILRGIKFSTQNPLIGWVVGDGGTILSTTDGGKTWNNVFKLLPQQKLQLAGVDFYSIFIDDNYCWVAGSKGKIVRIAYQP